MGLINTIKISSILGSDFVGGEVTGYLQFMFTWDPHLDGRYMKRCSNSKKGQNYRLILFVWLKEKIKNKTITCNGKIASATACVVDTNNCLPTNIL